MKRTRLKRRGGLGRIAEQLVWLANGLAESSSRIEDCYWERQLGHTLDEQLADNEEEALNAALDHLYSAEPRAYDELADFIESRAECAAGAFAEHDVVLIAAPILAWSRYRIPASVVPSAVLANLRVHLQAHVLATGARLALADFLFSPDHLPQGYCATAEFAKMLGTAAVDNLDLRIDTEGMPETAQFLSDTRYLLAAVAVPRGEAIFRWQEKDGSRDAAREQWRVQGGACLAPLLPGCAVDLVLPEPYFAASRSADKDSRPYSVRASVAYLGTALETPAANLRAVIAPFWDRNLEEYRVGFTVRNSDQVVHGVVWPLLGAEDDSTDSAAQIEAVLRESGLNDIVHLDHQFPLEYCDDCGAPMYPSPEGETVHAEMPQEQMEQMPRHLH
ncbi:DUF2863 family protein [Thauera linaloolentis]|uniref:DUF2863 domain-containing protein n=1 Tax=Thauera linaloolentis (strain DSM 12138 / JCM 21573 / CCUG 41526 / CIP 105981 / IAM 15112 / NBRC 102519 / 47Lol) TaxID=1123367 RepID=N6Y5W9_THAL4|nr:DUF2863 family protein [Thauera linaloolentis]ENO89611.1 hypothetical protein C666_05480 [Thauera linaloolentis 47Lol = DSM 12138]MCM8565929.1 DUF2863 family protein [Thauera linaloolentis]